MSDILHEIEIAAQLLAEAEKNYMNAATVASNARREETAALNNLNDKQKKFDAVIVSLRESSPGGHWKDTKRRGVEYAA